MADGYYEDLSVGQIHDRGQIIDLGAYWRDERKDYLNGKVIFRGCHHLHGALEGDEDWEIWKHTWSGDDNIRTEGPLPGSWSGRDGLSWEEDVAEAQVSVNYNITFMDLLQQTLNELKTMNIHLQSITDEELE